MLCAMQEILHHWISSCHHPLLTFDVVQDERMQSMMEDMRGKFKAVAASLGVLEAYFPSQKTSAAESLTF